MYFNNAVLLFVTFRDAVRCIVITSKLCNACMYEMRLYLIKNNLFYVSPISPKYIQQISKYKTIKVIRGIIFPIKHHSSKEAPKTTKQLNTICYAIDRFRQKQTMTWGKFPSRYIYGTQTASRADILTVMGWKKWILRCFKAYTHAH